MPSITTWTQLLPQISDENRADALQAKIYDPLWLMARQWQFGEFKGEDAGSPVVARIQAEGTPLNRYYPGIDPGQTPMQSRQFDHLASPLEALVEGENELLAASKQKNWRAAAEAGLHFCRLLKQNGVGQYCDGYRTYYPLENAVLNDGDQDPESIRFLSIMSGRTPDGKKLYDAIEQLPAGALPPRPVISSEDVSSVQSSIQAWQSWYRKRFAIQPAPATSWNPERMEYSFGVSAANDSEEHVLMASEYHGGKLDWHAFDLYAGNNGGTATNTDTPSIISQKSVPTAVSFKGMPANRWWEFEDAQVNFGAFNAEPTDLVRLVFMEFALSYGNDWFLIPVELEKGSIYTVQALIVTDTFGRKTLIQPYHEVDGPASPWRMFCPSPDLLSGGSPAIPPEKLFFLAPSLAGSLNSKAVEEVHLLRDEMTNLAWAVERLVENGLGLPLNRHEVYQRKQYTAQQEAEPANNATPTLQYRLLTSVPDYWIPFVPTRVSAGSEAIRLRRGRLVQDAAGEIASPPPKGQLLMEASPLDLFEEEVPRSGAHVIRHYQFARWINGTNHLWLGRRKRPGKGEGWSGLRFDAVQETQE